MLSIHLWNNNFPSAIGLAAGVDKNAERLSEFSHYGFIEVGTFTPLAQLGNPAPRIWKLANQKTIINHFGFNNAGATTIAENLAEFRKTNPHSIIGINIGKNKTATDYIADYVYCIEKAAQYANYIVLNVSSPNTPHLRDLQQTARLANLIRHCKAAIVQTCPKTPLLIKIAPDLSYNELCEVANVAWVYSIDGIIISNTTIKHPYKLPGGLSGLPLRDISTKQIAKMYQLTYGQIPIIGVGGIFTGSDAYEKIKAGASLVQLCSTVIFNGPNAINEISQELCELLRADGFTNISQAIGIANKRSKL